jgi:hypothetical protein
LEDITEDITKENQMKYKIVPYDHFMKQFFLSEMKRRRSYYKSNGFRCDEVDCNVIGCLKEIRIKWKEHIQGVSAFKEAIYINEIINLRPNLKEEIMEKFRDDVEMEKEVLQYNLINDICLLVLEVKE